MINANVLAAPLIANWGNFCFNVVNSTYYRFNIDQTNYTAMLGFNLENTWMPLVFTIIAFIYKSMPAFKRSFAYSIV